MEMSTLAEFEQKYGEDWLDSVCYPLPPDSIDDEMPHLKRSLFVQLRRVERLLSSGFKKCDSSSDDTKAYDVNVASLFSGALVDQTGERIVVERDTFTGKYVLVFCINAPVLFGSPDFQSLSNLCYELCTVRDDVKMIMVARMNALVDSEKVFRRLFSAFPSSCLAVPYEDCERREHIWNLLMHPSALSFLYGTDGSLLRSFTICGDIEEYGADAFPFDKKTLEEVKAKRDGLRKDRLEKLLRPYETSPDAVFVQELNGDVKKNILDVMENKHIGLYVCCDGDTLIPRLKKLYEQWKDKFEIVVLYLPSLSMTDPDTFQHRIDGFLRKQGIRGWCLPFNNSVSLRLWGLTEAYDCRSEYSWNHKWEDKLIIGGPDGKILDMYGGEVIKMNGGADMYPFTRAAAVEYKMKEVRREMRLESLLEGQHFFRGNNPSDVISASTLLSSNKEIIVYMGRPLEHTANSISYDFEGLVSQYKEMKNNGDDFEVVFVELAEEGGRGVTNDMEFAAMPWYVHCHLDGTYTSLANKLRGQFLVGFGEDGIVSSMKLLRELDFLGAGFALGDSLFQDLYHKYGFDNYRDI